MRNRFVTVADRLSCECASSAVPFPSIFQASPWKPIHVDGRISASLGSLLVIVRPPCRLRVFTLGEGGGGCTFTLGAVARFHLGGGEVCMFTLGAVARLHSGSGGCVACLHSGAVARFHSGLLHVYTRGCCTFTLGAAARLHSGLLHVPTPKTLQTSKKRCSSL